MNAPMYYNGKSIKFEETFRSPFVKSTEEEARKVLEAIRKAHPSYYGWVEFEGYVEKVSEGYRAVRHHALYK